MKKQLTKKEKGNKLESYVVGKLIEMGDKYARPTRGSGNKSEIGDVYSNLYYVECKHRDKKNIVIPISVIDKLKKRIPINVDKIPIWVYENIEGRKFVIIEAENFFI
ncbi:hypothetical protein DRN69_03330 [Candidatus Pacearchaeota archaeon]|nr:MAG: hypothetical protein DRN69_03330 [Candidatus Pacearchaeota archaeon]